MRRGDRGSDELRKISIEPGYNRYAEGSALMTFGDTVVHCTASSEPHVPKWLVNSEQGWVTAEYGMLPRSTHTRMQRHKTSESGRSQEISRIIARTLRSSIDLKKIPGKSILVDCDVLQADGGTRTAAITGGFVALALALEKMRREEDIKTLPLTHYISAVSVGICKGKLLLDLKYEEDCRAETDMNVAMTGAGEFVEIQGTAESRSFSGSELSAMLKLAQQGCLKLFQHQSEVLGEFFPLKLGHF